MIKRILKPVQEIKKASYAVYKLLKKAENIIIFNTSETQLSMYHQLDWCKNDRKWDFNNRRNDIHADLYNKYPDVFDDAVDDLCHADNVTCFGEMY